MRVPETLAVLLGALALDAVIGDPDALWRRWPHPVALIGRAIAWGDRRWNRASLPEARRRRAGAVALLGLVGICAALGATLEALLLRLP
ncbi:MAG: cobalamin biosynthesis protein, partial [Methylobacteriaceae bacterium]|nr:cobalamin biosynthesis protein [Methylobacteriaceae bacterium]